MRREVPGWLAIVIIVVVVVIVIGVYIISGRQRQLQPTTPPAGFKPGGRMGPYKGRGSPIQPPQPSQPTPPPSGGAR